MADVKEKLPFEDGGLWENPFAMGEGWRHYRVGTCNGLYRAINTAYEILAIVNDKPGNGHVEACLSWFFQSCKRDQLNLVIREILNEKFGEKLLRLGFTRLRGKNDYIFYHKEIQHGNTNRFRFL